jgi:uncharacterized protein (TIGR02145 family)
MSKINQKIKTLLLFLLLLGTIPVLFAQQQWEIPVEINTKDTTYLSVSLCKTNGYMFNGQLITIPGIYYDTLTNIHGCDSLIVLHAHDSTVVHAYTHSILIQDTYTFGGQILQSPGVYYDTIIMLNGCDSIVELTLIVYDASGFVICDFTYDYEGNLYVGVDLMGLCWFTTNMLTQYDSLGNSIPSWVYNSSQHNNTVNNLARFGRLYDWNTAQGICPAGWRLPTADEYLSLIENYPSADLRMSGQNYWMGEAVTNNTHLSLVPSGYYNGTANSFYKLLGDAYLWTGDPVSTEIALACHLVFGCPHLYIVQVNKGWGMSVRCVKE